MVIRHANLPIATILENIENDADQKEAIRVYMQGPLWRFLRWYSENDFSHLSGKLDYVQDRRPDVNLGSRLKELESLKGYPEKQQIAILERIFCFLDPADMMLLENCLTRDLKEYYPGIDWSLFDEFVKL